VDWVGTYERRSSRRPASVRGHVEVRWSHGRFAQPPEAKIYLDTPTDQLPGYYSLGTPGSTSGAQSPVEAQPQLFDFLGADPEG
jgi:hypothetical protein